jgi:hypothetical protein
MSFSVKRRAYSDRPSVLSQSSIRCIAARHRGFIRDLTELLGQGDRELIRQIPSIVRRWTKQAKQLSLRSIAADDVPCGADRFMSELGHQRPFGVTASHFCFPPEN